MQDTNYSNVELYYNERYKSDKENDIKPWQISEGVRPHDAYPMILYYLKVKPTGKLLDIACGRGYLLKAAESKGLDTFGVDISDEAVKLARLNAVKSDIRVSKAEELPYNDKFFDYITCLGSLEHFLKPEEAAAEMVRVGKDDAVFCIMVPNANFIYW